MIEPLHPAAPKACLKDSKLYEYLALCDALRVSKAREKNLVIDFLYQTITYIFNNFSITNINGYALKDNKAANRINKFLGFRDSIPSKSNEVYYYTEIQKHIWQSEVLNNDNVIKLVAQTQKYYNNEI